MKARMAVMRRHALHIARRLTVSAECVRIDMALCGATITSRIPAVQAALWFSAATVVSALVNSVEEWGLQIRWGDEKPQNDWS